MIKQLLALDGVMAVCKFRDDGMLVEGYGPGGDDMLQRLAKFAHDYKRMVQGNADQLSMFTQINGWTPPGGWVVRGPAISVCSIANLVCVVDLRETSLNTIMTQLKEAAAW
jgi:roadblock/LC7 domain-containing protein